MTDPTKRGLKREVRASQVGAVEGFNDRPDEKGTETSARAVEVLYNRPVSMTDPTKRGLKLQMSFK